MGRAVDELTEFMIAAEEMIDAHDEDIYLDPRWPSEHAKVNRCHSTKERLRKAVATINGR